MQIRNQRDLKKCSFYWEAWNDSETAVLFTWKINKLDVLIVVPSGWGCSFKILTQRSRWKISLEKLEIFCQHWQLVNWSLFSCGLRVEFVRMAALGAFCSPQTFFLRPRNATGKLDMQHGVLNFYLTSFCRLNNRQSSAKKMTFAVFSLLFLPIFSFPIHLLLVLLSPCWTVWNTQTRRSFVDPRTASVSQESQFLCGINNGQIKKPAWESLTSHCKKLVSYMLELYYVWPVSSELLFSQCRLLESRTFGWQLRVRARTNTIHRVSFWSFKQMKKMGVTWSKHLCEIVCGVCSAPDFFCCFMFADLRRNPGFVNCFRVSGTTRQTTRKLCCRKVEQPFDFCFQNVSFFLAFSRFHFSIWHLIDLGIFMFLWYKQKCVCSLVKVAWNGCKWQNAATIWPKSPQDLENQLTGLDDPRIFLCSKSFVRPGFEAAEGVKIVVLACQPPSNRWCITLRKPIFQRKSERKGSTLQFLWDLPDVSQE